MVKIRHKVVGKAINTADKKTLPAKRYFSIGEVSDFCDIKSHVLRYWEQEFPQLKPLKRRGNRRYYRAQDVALIQEIQSLLYEQGYTIQGARFKIAKRAKQGSAKQLDIDVVRDIISELEEVLDIMF